MKSLPHSRGPEEDARPRPERRGYLDWLRGVGVLIMIEAHTLDSWTQLAERTRAAYRWAIVVGGFGAPIFLFLAGVTLVLAVHSRIRRGMTEDEAARRAIRRAGEVFGLAFLFRLQSVVISGGGLRSLLKVDILNVMGLSMLIAACLWRFGRTPGRRLWLLAGATALAAMVTPAIRSTPALAWLPDPIEAYLRPEAGRSTFTLFPWSGFLFGGVVAGAWLDRGSRDGEARRLLFLLGSGVLIGTAGYAAAFLPPIYQETSFWTSSPTFFFVRLGIVTTLVPLAFAWMRVWAGRWSPLREFGVASLFVYWIHVEMVYGIVSGPVHHALTLEQSLLGMLLFAVALFGLVRLKNRLIRSRASGRNAANFSWFRASAAPNRTQSG